MQQKKHASSPMYSLDLILSDDKHTNVEWKYKWKVKVKIREGVKKILFFLGLCPKHRTPPTHRARLGLH